MCFFFILLSLVTMTQEQIAKADTDNEIPGTHQTSLENLATDPEGALTNKIKKLCDDYMPGSGICKSNELMGMLGFFIFSTIISLVFGIFRTCIFRCKTCCIYGTRSSRRKRMEEERQENEMFQQQMTSLQMRKNLLTRQQKSLKALMQGPNAQGKGKKKKKSSKKEPENSTNVFGVGYIPVSQ